MNTITNELKEKYSKLHSAKSFFALTKNEETDDEEEQELCLTTEEKEKFKELVSEMHEKIRIKIRQERLSQMKGINGTKDEIRYKRLELDKEVKKANKALEELHKNKIKEIELL